MKTTVELDMAKLKRVMALGGFQTQREAIDYALTEAERQGRLQQLLKKRWSAEELREAVDPGYDLLKLREMEKPTDGDTR